MDRDWRTASRPVLPVTFSGTLAEAGTMMVSGPGQKRRASMIEAVVQLRGQFFGHHRVGTRRGSER